MHIERRTLAVAVGGVAAVLLLTRLRRARDGDDGDKGAADSADAPPAAASDDDLVRADAAEAATVAALPAITGYLNFGAGTHARHLPKDDTGGGGDGSDDARPASWRRDEEGQESVPMRVHDARSRAGDFTLHEHSFQLVRAPACSVGLDLYDANVAVRDFYPVLEALVLGHCAGATRAIAFDHIVRNAARLAAETEATAAHEAEAALAAATTSISSAPAGDAVPPPASPPPPRRTPFLQGALANVHGDYTARSGRTRAAQLLAPFASAAAIDAALAGRFAIVNVWHPLAEVRADPLAVSTWRSIGPRDVRTNRLTFTHRVGETYKAAPSERQRWMYFSGMHRGEALLLKTFDSTDDDGGRTARFSLHSAFELPEQRRSPPGGPPLPPRESIEVRVLVLWGDGLARLARGFEPPHMAGPTAAATAMEQNALLKKETLPPSDEW